MQSATRGATYDAGRLCPKGHTTLRYVSNRLCPQCLSARAHAWQKANRDRYRVLNREHQRETVKGVARSFYIRSTQRDPSSVPIGITRRHFLEHAALKLDLKNQYPDVVWHLAHGTALSRGGLTSPENVFVVPDWFNTAQRSEDIRDFLRAHPHYAEYVYHPDARIQQRVRRFATPKRAA